MGEILLAEQEGLGHQVALKILPREVAQDPEAIARFQREIHVLAGLSHPHICPIIEAGCEEGTHFYAMEYLAGLDLETVLRLQTIDVRRAVEIAKQTAEALHFAHEHGVIHRDVKPRNIVLVRGEARKPFGVSAPVPGGVAGASESRKTDWGATSRSHDERDSQGRTRTPAETHHDHAYLIDFGLALRPESVRLTVSGAVMGTPAYMAPEQAGGDVRGVGPATDVYAVGVMSYELLTGRPPFIGDTIGEVLRKVTSTDPVSLRKLKREIPKDLDVITLKCLEKKPGRRYASAQALADDLGRFLEGEPIEARPPGAWYRMRRRMSRNRAAWIAGGMAAILAVALLVGWRVWGRGPQEEPWVVVLEDQFDRAELGADWTGLRGKVSIHDGALCSRGGHVVFGFDFSDHVRFEYTARVMEDSADARELSAFVSGSEKEGLAQGYSFEYGILDGAGQPYHCIQKNRQVARAEASGPAVRGQAYRLTAWREGTRLRLLEGYRVVVTLDDPTPLGGEGHGRVGFGSKCAHLHYDDVRVSLPLGHAREFTQKMLALRDWGKAEAATEGILAVEPDAKMREVMRAKKCWLLTRLGRGAEAEAIAGELYQGSNTPEVILAAGAAIVECQLARGDPTGALRRVLEVTLRAPSSLRSQEFLEAARATVLRLEDVPPVERERVLREVILAHENPTMAIRGNWGALGDELIFALADALKAQGKTFNKMEVCRLALSNSFIEHGGLENARSRAKEARVRPISAALDPSDATDYLSGLGLWELAEGTESAARKALHEAEMRRSHSTTSMDANESFGWALLGDSQRALSAVDEWSRNEDAKFWVPRLLLYLGRDDEAMAAFRSMREHDYVESDEVALLSGRIQLADFENRTRLEKPEIKMAGRAFRSFWLGLFQECSGNAEKAIEYYRLVLDDPLPPAQLIAFLHRRRWRLLGLPPPGGRINYAIVASKQTADQWKPVIQALERRHVSSEALTYDTSVDEIRARLAELHPRYACFVAPLPDRPFVVAVNRLTRALDEDPYSDCLWGILTGYDMESALRIAEDSGPLQVRRAAAGCGVDLDSFDEGAWYSECEKNVMWENKPGGRPEKRTAPDDTTASLVQELNTGKPDFFMTSGHATFRDWQIGYSYPNGQFRCEKGQLFGLDLAGKRFDITSTNPKVYLAGGNCLMGHIPDSEAMALAWMKTGGARQMVGYTVSTWYGHGGWGVPAYFVQLQGRHTFAESFFFNQQALLYALESRFPKTARVNMEDFDIEKDGQLLDRFAQKNGISDRDNLGLLWDRDTVAFYGDPAWEARVEKAREAPYDQVLVDADGTSTFTITSRTDKPWERPAAAFLPYRVRNVKLSAGIALVTDDFILVPPPERVTIGEVFKVVFTADRQ
ncbi:MAG: serine/threonine protein kinase [Planctomycetes bacterium]|nr:serine/threonine protein kinase [Planctomycetota bacterium]